MEFKFDNVLLPDSNINEPLSHGLVHYRIKPNTLVTPVDSIGNQAYIYFDFNESVATNKAVTIIEYPRTYSSFSDTACDHYLSPSGKYNWISTGSYRDTLVNHFGGDSIITMNLFIKEILLAKRQPELALRRCEDLVELVSAPQRASRPGERVQRL